MTRFLAALILTALARTVVPTPSLAAETADVVIHYADMAAAKYADSLTTAKTLQSAVLALTIAPSEETLTAAKEAWLAARVPYQQTEVYRFGNAVVDDWEGRVNAWPLAEGLIDYVAAESLVNGENAPANLNVIASPLLTLSGNRVDASVITPALIAGTLHEADGIEANVASGYHAIEFLLWGQDMNDKGPGARPYTDYLQSAGCTGGNCDRRAAYLLAATELLVSDLEYMMAQWSDGGQARLAVISDPEAGILTILTGMGSLSYGELAGERMKLGLMLNDPEEEHDCFSDNTHNSHFYNAVGIRNVYLGRYLRLDGTEMTGPALTDLVAATAPAVDARLKAELDASVAATQAIKTAAEGGFPYDQMLTGKSKEGERLIMQAVGALVLQTTSIQQAVTMLGLSTIEIEGSDNLDSPEAVFR